MVADTASTDATTMPPTTGLVTSTGTSPDLPAADTSSSTGANGCVPSVEIGSFTLVTEIGLGDIQLYDFDRDDLADLVGGNGVIAYQRADGFEIVASPEPIVPSSALAGRFDGDDEPDLLFRISDTRLRLHIGGAEAPVVDTLIADVSSLESGDMDGDGIDDLVVGIDNGGRIQTWRGTASGVFEQTTSTSWQGLAHGTFAALEPPRIDLVVLHGDLHVFVGDGAGGFTAADSVPVFSSGVAAFRGGDRDSLLLSWSWTQIETYSGVGLVRRDDQGALSGVSYDTAPRTPGASTAADLDGDGALEVVVLLANTDEVMLEIACPLGDALILCGTALMEHSPGSLVVLPGTEPRVVYATSDDGTWIAPIATQPCE